MCVALSVIKSEITDLKQAQIAYYYPILKNGTDTRDMGIYWVVNTLKSLNQEIKLTMMPKFLDKDCIQFILKYAGMHENLAKLKEQYKQLRSEILAQKEKVFFIKKSASTTDFLNDNTYSNQNSNISSIKQHIQSK